MGAVLGCTGAVASYGIPWYALTSGGGTSQEGAYQLEGAAGQSSVGSLSGASYALQGGYLVDAAVCRAPAGSPGLVLDKQGTDAQLSWSALPSAVAYDVLSGDLSALRLSGGDYSSILVNCEADDLGGTSIVVDTAGSSWFLVRGVACQNGAYESGGAGQSVPRDPLIEQADLPCP
jgi:hypothetical protein